MMHLTFDPARGYGQKGCNMRIRREYNPKTIGRNLRRLRVRAGYSADEVREYLCLGSVQAVYKQERGESYPQADTLMALLELYEADFKDITREFEEDDKSSSFLYNTLLCIQDHTEGLMNLFAPISITYSKR